MCAIQNKRLPFLMWLLPLAFFAYQFILRLWPGLMMNQIMERFSIDATYFGLLASFYYYGYAGMQIPIAVLLDRYGPRYVLFSFTLLCGGATILFTCTDNFYLALFSRFLVGAGSAAGFLAVSKVVSQWFPKDNYAKMIGFSFTIGLMGAVYGGKPVSLLIAQHGGYKVAVTLGVISIVLGLLAYTILRSPKNNNHANDTEPFKLSDLKNIVKSKVVWGLAIANLLMVGALEGFADVWGVQYLVTVYSLDKGDAAALISNIFYGMIVGGPLLAFLSKKFGNYVVIGGCGLGMALSFMMLIWNHQYHSFALSCLFFVVGIMCCYQVIVFAAGSELVSLKQLGVTVAFLNCINMLGGSFFHTIIGVAMDMFWTGEVGSDNIRVYSVETFRYAILAIPLCGLLGTLIVGFIANKAKKLAKISASL